MIDNFTFIYKNDTINITVKKNIKRKVKMAKPLRLVMVRHGQSEANIVQHAQKKNQKIFLEEQVEGRADWQQRLSPLGKEQAVRASENISKIYGGMNFFDIKYVSPFIRTRETAALISGAGKTNWKIEDLLIERLWGNFGRVSNQDRNQYFPLTNRFIYNDPFYMRLDGGESIYDVYCRFRNFEKYLEGKGSNQNVIIVSHKQFIQAACYAIERLLPEEWDWPSRRDSYDIPNLGLVEYSRVNPFDACDVRDEFAWRRVIKLGSEDISYEWEEFERKSTFTTEEMKAQISRIAPFIKE